tara:strand:+ start:40 stop:471 length:432 start_codon:yes stop_codon:yes gene_type:complete
MHSDLDITLINIEGQLPVIKKEGEKLIEKNPFFKDLTTVMKNTEVKTFFDKYFTDMNSIKTTVIYMKIFRLLQEKYKTLSEKELSDYVNIYLLHRAMTTDGLRTKLINDTLEHLEDNRNPILNLTPNLLNNRKTSLKKIKDKK